MLCTRRNLRVRLLDFSTCRLLDISTSRLLDFSTSRLRKSRSALININRNPFQQTPFASHRPARAAEVTKRAKQAHVLACVTVTRARARRTRARPFGARGPRQIAMRSRLSIFRRWKNKKTNTLTHSLPAPCGLVRRSLYGVSASYVPVTSSQSYSRPRNMASR